MLTLLVLPDCFEYGAIIYIIAGGNSVQRRYCVPYLHSQYAYLSWVVVNTVVDAVVEHNTVAVAEGIVVVDNIEAVGNLADIEVGSEQRQVLHQPHLLQQR